METSTEWRALIICPDAALLDSLRGLLPASGVREVQAWPSYPAAAEVEKQLRPEVRNICFLDVGSDHARALELLEQLAAGAAPVVALDPHSDPDLILRCLRYGASEFLYQPLKADDLRAALERLARRHNAKPASGSLYCFLPGKPASGSTTLACNLAVQLQRMTTRKVLLADLDPLLGSISFLLKLKSHYGLADALRDWARMDEEVWKQLVTEYQGVHVLLAPEAPAPLRPDRQALPRLVEFWRPLYGSVVVDSAGAYSEIGLEMARISDVVLLVTTNELSSLHGTRRTLEYLAGLGVEPARLKLVLNRYSPQFGLAAGAVEKALGREVYAVIPNDFAAAQSALLDGRSMRAGSKLQAAVSGLAQKLTGTAPPRPAPRKISPRLAWWRRPAPPAPIAAALK